MLGQQVSAASLVPLALDGGHSHSSCEFAVAPCRRVVQLLISRLSFLAHICCCAPVRRQFYWALMDALDAGGGRDKGSGCSQPPVSLLGARAPPCVC